MRLWNEHRKERRIIQLDPEALSIERVHADTNRWLKGMPGRNLAEVVNSAIESSVPKGWLQDEQFWQIFVTRYRREAQKLLEMANSLLADRFTVFQWKEIRMGSPVRWSATMEPGRPDEEWPDRYYADIDFDHDENRPDLDVKWCWELNRFQHLLCLGAAWRISHEERYAVKAREHLESWMARVRYPLGIQWSSNLEAGLRALSWARCHLLCLNSKAWDSSFLDRFVTCLYLHAYHLEKELTVHHAEGNHLLGEASALFQLSVLYPVFSESSRWLRRSVAIIDRLTPRLIYSDGVYVEQSTGYFRFIAEFLLPVIHLANHSGITVSEVVSDRLAAGFDFIRAISLGYKEVPMIGDSDTGVAIGWRLSDFWDFSSLLSAAGVLLERYDLNKNAETFPAESLLITGCEGLDAFEAQKKIPVAGMDEVCLSSGFAAFPSGGYLVSADDSFGIIFDAGQLGISPGYEHGHADGLSFQMGFHGKAAITDTGTMLYNGDPRWRNYFRGTAAHNTLRIDGKDQSTPIATFRWSGPLNIKLFDPVGGTDWRLLRGCLKLRSVDHTRTILHLLGQGIIVMDSITGPGAHLLEWSMHFGPDWTIEKKNGRLFGALSGADHLDILLLGIDSGQVSVLHESTEPMGGWYSRFYGSVIPTSSIRASTVRTLPTSTVTAIKPLGRQLSLPGDIPESIMTGEMLQWLRSDFFSSFSQPFS